MNTGKPQQIIEAKIVEFSKKGNGLAFIEKPEGAKKWIEVPFTLPGDTARFTPLNKKRGVSNSRLLEIISPSPDRQTPRCAHYAVCGGCRWQNLSYEKQLLLKQEKIKESFTPLLEDGITVEKIIPCDPPWQYRNKMEFSFSNDAAKNHYLGLIIDSSKGRVLNLKECHLVHPWFIDALTAVREWWKETSLAAYHPHSDSGSLRTLTLREGMRSGDRLAMLTVSGNPDFALKKQDLESFTACLRQAIEPLEGQLSIFLRIHQAKKGMATQFYEMLLYGPDHIRETLFIQIDSNLPATALTFSVSPSAFFQPNTRQAEKLYSTALQMLDITKESVIYDLYCGTGTLGICLAKHVKQVIGIEISPESSLDARTNISNNNIKNMTVLTGSVPDIVKKMRSENQLPHPDIVMVDPPRPGLDAETIKHLIELRPRTILYVSCNPATQAENVIQLKEAGYRILAVQPVDQFPQTVHIENIVVLRVDAASQT